MAGLEDMLDLTSVAVMEPREMVVMPAVAGMEVEGMVVVKRREILWSPTALHLLHFAFYAPFAPSLHTRALLG